jgi:hypothetical protein
MQSITGPGEQCFQGGQNFGSKAQNGPKQILRGQQSLFIKRKG